MRVRRTGSLRSRGTPVAYGVGVDRAENARHTRHVPRHTPSNILTTLVFTDIVGSTRVAEELGDRRWRELLSRHHRIVREALREHNGRELDTAGDGVFARFDSPTSAIRFAAAVSDALCELGIEIRAGVHIGDVEVFDGKLSGVNVHVAARTMATAGAAEILVTGSVRDLVRGGGFGLVDRGTHELRGTEGTWRLFEVTSLDGTPRLDPLPEREAQARRAQIVPPPLVKTRRARLSAIAGGVAIVLAGAAFALAHSVGNTTWGIGVRDEVTNPESANVWQRHMDDLIRERCGLIVTIGGDFESLTAAAAHANPGLRFASTDASSVQGTANLLGIVFKQEQAAFLAGYLASALTKTHKIGTFGGLPLETVTPFMDGFAAGVLYYNRVHRTNVRLLGWHPRTQKGIFVSTDTSNFGAFGDTGAASALSDELIRPGGRRHLRRRRDRRGGRLLPCGAANT